MKERHLRAKLPRIRPGMWSAFAFGQICGEDVASADGQKLLAIRDLNDVPATRRLLRFLGFSDGYPFFEAELNGNTNEESKPIRLECRLSAGSLVDRKVTIPKFRSFASPL